MRYPNICRAQFVARPNRFVARVLRHGTEETVHVKNTGRCRELLVPGATVYLTEGDNPHRKTRYDLVAVEKGPLLVNLDSQAPNKVFAEWARAGNFRPGLTLLRPETVWGNSRFDFYWEAADGGKGFVEVKGVTLEEKGHARFPDAPTLRGGQAPGGTGPLPGRRVRSGGLLCAADGGHGGFCPQRRHPPGIRGGAAPGRRRGSAGAGHGMCRHTGQPDIVPPGAGAAVTEQTRNPQGTARAALCFLCRDDQIFPAP